MPSRQTKETTAVVAGLGAFGTAVAAVVAAPVVVACGAATIAGTGVVYLAGELADSLKETSDTARREMEKTAKEVRETSKAWREAAESARKTADSARETTEWATLVAKVVCLLACVYFYAVIMPTVADDNEKVFAYFGLVCIVLFLVIKIARPWS